MRIVIVIVQLVLTLLVVSLLMPVLLAKVPAMRQPAIGPAMMAGSLLLVFVILRLVWPGGKRK